MRFKYFLIILMSFFSVLNQGMATVDCIEIIKHKRVLNLIKGDKVYKTYRIALGKSPKGHKQVEGDNKTPQGRYFIKRKLEKSQFHRSLVISYPNPSDKQYAQMQGKDPGNNICIHGLATYLKYVPTVVQKMHRLYDWTQGCIAVTDNEIEEIYAEVDVGTPVIIFA